MSGQPHVPQRKVSQRLKGNVVQHIFFRGKNARATNERSTQLFSTIAGLEDLVDPLQCRPMYSGRDLEFYERLAVENHVRDIFLEVCKLPPARRRFRLGDGVWFESHTNALEEG
ncbi:uncharacterized protein ATNIH1004_008610 [Aspergillus tanneri]|uniref:Uncharacterized protein n=1 Tax=Aspergillus tanneri TaxID=1220188 RepID=A0A5M9MF74_9EURO|nr:uncharacterized protein ATNIH1004_008610 [Aspergillus tanneri]KAA8644406.1 hypothetical protein ATNIH1004_008610 [Aspergillus tanneri]